MESNLMKRESKLQQPTLFANHSEKIYADAL